MRIIKPKNEINPDYKIGFITKLIATGFFVGYAPIASGTLGSLLAFLIYLIPGFSDFTVMCVFIIIFFIIGVFVSEIMQRRYGFDPPEIIIDEIVGMWFTFVVSIIVLSVFIKFKKFNPFDDFTTKMVFGLTSFFIFRFFDIIKLQPGKYLDEMKNGWGIMMDDIVAALYAGILSAVVSHFIWFRIFIRIV